MTPRQRAVTSILAAGILAALAAPSSAETFKGTATVKTAAGATATFPVVVVVDRTMPQAEADKLGEAFKTGGVAGLKKALTGVKPTGSVQLGAGKPTPTRITIERTTDKGRLLTIVTDQPLAFLGASLPNAKPKEGYDLGVVDLHVDAQGKGAGTVALAAKVTAQQGAFVVQDYASELVKLTDVSASK